MIDNKFTVIDSHCHIYPIKIAKPAVESTGRFYDMTALGDGTVNSLLALGEKVGIDRFVVQSVATTPHQVQSINKFISDEVSAFPDKLIGLGTMHPESSDLKGDLAHLKELGLHGVKLHADIQKFRIDDPRCFKIYELCEKENIPILMHTGDHRFDYSNPDRLLPVLNTFKSLTVIGAHLGGWSVWDEAVEKLSGYKNFYVDSSSSLYELPIDRATEIIRTYGVEKVLFGSDFPVFSPDIELERFMALPLTDDEKRMILSENVLKLYNIK
ncbi:MAG: amidohydrolase family protein [Clostridia bacterium]|nr:amidohydrolase family protein [Clostridia bacterium]